MATLGDLMAAVGVYRGPLDYLPREPTGVRTTPQGGLDLGSIMQGAGIDHQRSQYEPTLRPGETRSREELQSMLWNVVQSAGMESLPGIGPHKLAQQNPGSRPAPGGAPVEMPRGAALREPIKGSNGRAIVGYEWQSRIEDVQSARDGGLVAKRVSDWGKSGTSAGTGRRIVHHFYVQHPDGSVTLEGVNSANNLLGIEPARLKTIASHAQGEQQAQARATKAFLSEYAERSTPDANEAHRQWATQAQRLAASVGSNGKRYEIKPGIMLRNAAGRYLKLDPDVVDARRDVLDAGGWAAVAE
jgi:hypothetical protein